MNLLEHFAQCLNLVETETIKALKEKEKSAEADETQATETTPKVES